MDHWEELQRLQHQLELANRAISFIGDQATVNRLATFAKEIKDKLDELQAATLREEIRRRAVTSGRKPTGLKGATSNSGCGREVSNWAAERHGKTIASHTTFTSTGLNDAGWRTRM